MAADLIRSEPRPTRAAVVTSKVAVVVIAATLLTLSAGCSGQQATSPYADLEESARRYVIPHSDGWGAGDPCPDEGSCSGPVTPDQVAESTWLRVIEFDVDDGAGDDHHVVAQVIGEPLTVSSTEGADSGEGERYSLQMWGTDVDDVVHPLQSGLEVWVRLCDESLEERWACNFVAVDDQGRFAALGRGMGTWFTVPMANSAAEADAATGRSHLLKMTAEP